MIYRNERTGAVIETTAEIRGGGWQEVKPAALTEPAQEKEDKSRKTGRRTGK